MQETSIGRGRIAAFAMVVLVALPVCLGIYSNRSNAYRQTASTAKTPTSKVVDFSNGQILRNWVPASVYTQTVNTLNNYFSSQNLTITGMKITSKQIDTSQGNFDFNMIVLPQQSSHAISVRVRNFDGTLSNLIVIDGQAQNIQASSTPTTTQPTNNLDSFGNYGLTSVQLNELMQAFLKFAPNTQNIQAATPHYTYGSDGTSTLSFVVHLDKAAYLAQVTTNDLTSVRLTLKNPSNQKQVFDSGIVGTSQ